MQAWLTWRPTRDTSVQSFVRCRRARALMLRYLSDAGDRRLTSRVFPAALRYSLQRHLAIGKGDNLVRHAQHIAVQVSIHPAAFFIAAFIPTYRLVLRMVNVRRYTAFVFNQAIRANSAWPSLASG